MSLLRSAAAVACALVAAMPAGAARAAGQGGHGTHGGGTHGGRAPCLSGQGKHAVGPGGGYAAAGGTQHDFQARASEIERYYSDPTSIGYVPYCDAASLYYDPESCVDFVLVLAGPSRGPSSRGSGDRAPPMSAPQGNVPEPYAGRGDLFGPVVPGRGAPGRAAGTYEEPGASIPAVPYGTGGSRGYTAPDVAR